MTEESIKQMLKDKFKGVGNFQQTEFNSSGGSSRRDFVILGDNYFYYYEIKTDKDNFSRLPSQISNAIGLFTKMYIVAPVSKIAKLRNMGVAVGLHAVEDLENGREWVFEDQKVEWRLSINKVMEILWSEDLKGLISDRCQNYKGLRKSVKELQDDFLKFYSDEDCFFVLNKVLPHRKFNYRESNGSKNL